MSLLNDALRAAEQRQGRQPAPAAYTGQAAAAPAAGRHAGWLILVVLALLLLVAGWWLISRPSPVVESTATPVVVQSPVATEAEPEPESVAQPVAEDRPSEPVVVTPRLPEPAPMERSRPPEPQRVAAQAPQPVPDAEPKSEREADPEPAAASVAADVPADAQRPSTVRLSGSDDGFQAAADVKQVRETPEVKDRRTSRELERMLRAGRWAEARQVLEDLTAVQDAPLSRHVVAKRLLVEGQYQQALDLLPEPIAQTSAPLRLLRARALLESGALEAALSMLLYRVPGVAEHTEYHVTLATLLHQRGHHDDAASRWAELIAWDDSQAPWWVGLAIALESGGQREAARRAFLQASELPGLPPSLADYVRQRLQSLRAG